jgi:D-aminoacyl-tRNA deacylase
MRLVVQRVTRAEVRSAGALLGRIGRGAVVLVGVAADDTPQTADRMAGKLLGLRYFEDGAGRTNLDLATVGGDLLVVSQFTLYADVRRGRRPGFSSAAVPEAAAPLVERLVTALRNAGVRTATGRFGAEMELELVNDGPFTLVVDSARDLGGPAERGGGGG